MEFYLKKYSLLFFVFIISGCSFFYEEKEFSFLQSQKVLFINEYSNNNTDEDDWIELYNSSETAIDLSRISLNDDLLGEKWTFPSGSIIPGKSFEVVICDGKEENGSTDFKLKMGESIILIYTDSGKDYVIDRIDDIPDTYNGSYGLEIDGGGIYKYFEEHTMGRSNES